MADAAVDVLQQWSLTRHAGAVAFEAQRLRVAEQSHVDRHAEQRRQHVERAAVGHDQHRCRLRQRLVEGFPLAGHELGQGLAARGRAGPVDVRGRGADQLAEVALAQALVHPGRDAVRRRHRLRRGQGPMHVAAHDAADRLAGQQLGGARRLLQAERAERFVGGLEDAPRIALGLAMAQEVEVVAGRRERMRGGQGGELEQAGIHRVGSG